MHYRSIADLNAAVAAMLPRIPRDVDLVVGIPRSGLLAASIVALLLNRPLTDLRGLVERRLLQSGKRLAGSATGDAFASLRRVLVVDDSVRSGSALREAREQLAAADVPWPLEFAAVYVTPDSVDVPDLYGEVVPLPRMFAWNVMHHAWLQKCCVDLDGVLCRDPRPEELDGGPRYAAFLRDAEPFLLPTVPVGWIVSERSERDRAATEEWLARHGVVFDRLVLLDGSDPVAAATASGRFDTVVRHKARSLVDQRGMLFLESDPRQAQAIADRAARSVLCVATQQLHDPKTVAGTVRSAARRVGGPLRRRLHDATTRVVGRLFERKRAR